MRSTENFLKLIDPRNTENIDGYIQALASSPDDDATCPNKAACLVEARALREQSVAYHNARAPVDAAIASRDQTALEEAVVGAADLSGSPLEVEFARLIENDAKPLLDLVTLENEQRDKPDEVRFYVVSRDILLDLHRNPKAFTVTTARVKEGGRGVALRVSPAYPAERIGNEGPGAGELFAFDATETVQHTHSDGKQHEITFYRLAPGSNTTGWVHDFDPTDPVNPSVEVLPPATNVLPVFQDLRKQGQLRSLVVNRSAALRGELRTGACKVLAISYPWQGHNDPDSTGDRVAAVAAHLEEHPEIDAVWWDYMCVPQNTDCYKKNAFETLYFQAMINHGGVNLIYLGAFVLSIVNSLYIQRFWTQFEYLLATRTVTCVGFQTSYDRSFVRCIQSLKSSTAEQKAALQKKWTNVATAVAVAILGEKDVTVTNQSDKEFLLGKLPDLEVELMALAMDVPELAAALAAAPGDTMESLRAQLAAMTQRAEVAEKRARRRPRRAWWRPRRRSRL